METGHSPEQCRWFARSSLLRQPRLAHAVKQKRYIRRMIDQPADGEFGIKASGLRQSGSRLFHLVLERVGGGQIDVRHENAKTGVDRPMILVGRGIEMPGAEFRIAQNLMPAPKIGVART